MTRTGNSSHLVLSALFRVRTADVPDPLQCRKNCLYKIPGHRREKRVARIPGKPVVGKRKGYSCLRRAFFSGLVGNLKQFKRA